MIIPFMYATASYIAMYVLGQSSMKWFCSIKTQYDPHVNYMCAYVRMYVATHLTASNMQYSSTLDVHIIHHENCDFRDSHALEINM